MPMTRPQALAQLKAAAARQLHEATSPVAGDPDSFTKADLDAAVKSYVASAQKVVDRFWKSSKHTVGTDSGPKYIRLWQADEGGSKSALGFIDKTTGFLLKSDGWKKPAKGPRGDVFKDDASKFGGNGAIG
jgi:hypothetical protein